MRVVLTALGAGLVILLGTMVAAIVVSAQARRRMDAKLVQLEREVARDRGRRVQLERDIADERRRAAEGRERRQSEVSAQIASLRAEEQRLKQQLEESREHASASASQLAAMQGKLLETKRQITTLDTERSLAERIIRSYQAGVGLVTGTWTWQDAAGHPARYASVDENGEPARDGTGAPMLAVDGTGATVLAQFVGTGFLVSRDGMILTNRHIAEPWWREKDTRALVAKGLVPRVDELEIFFPGVDSPFPVTVAAVSHVGDVALLKAEIAGRKLPLVEMEPDPGAARPGQPVVILGYPTGLDAILARIDDPVADAIVASGHGDWARVARELSRRGMIRPLATQGHISDVLETQLVYDALTAQGGSGGPVFNARGHVIGLTSAAMTDFPGATFGVPIRFGLDLLPPAPSRRKVTGRQPRR